ncbi:hypothetical protein D3C81_1985210 [compost metagenome]
MERILRRRTDENNSPLLHGGQQRILARTVETVHLVQEKNRLGTVQRFVALGALDDLPHVLHRGLHRIQAYKFTLGVVGNDMGQSRLAAARGAIEQY